MKKRTALLASLGALVLFSLVMVDCRSAPPQELAEPVDLPEPQKEGTMSVEEAISKRRSVRRFADRELSMEQVSQLAWAAQGITDPQRGFRAAPSAGATYPLELYLVKSDGTYHYIPAEHRLMRMYSEDVRGPLADASLGQAAVREAALNVVIAAVFERTRARYGSRADVYVYTEAGHVAENLHLQAVALGLGSVPIGAFRKAAVAEALGLPQDHEPIYIISIGYPR